jgi:DNA-binding LytR/AlgR family response regulator
MKIQTLIVDDEAIARRSIREWLRNDPEIELVGEAEDGEEAYRLIQKQRPDLLILDIEMPRMNGIELAQKLLELEKPPVVIFLTAYEKHAVRAFEVQAFDYLLKPCDLDRFEKTLARAKRLLGREGEFKEKLASILEALAKAGLTRVPSVGKIACHRKGSVDKILINLEEVDYFRADDDLVWVQSGDRELLTSGTLSSLHQRLNPVKFRRCHKSFVVNVDRIEKISPMFSKNFTITIANPKKDLIPLPRTYRHNFEDVLR